MGMIKDKVENLRVNCGHSYKAGLEVGAETFLNYYENYRRYSPAVFLVVLVYCLFTKQNIAALICFGVLHIHVLINQVWWKMKNIEHYYLKKEE